MWTSVGSRGRTEPSALVGFGAEATKLENLGYWLAPPKVEEFFSCLKIFAASSLKMKGLLLKATILRVSMGDSRCREGRIALQVFVCLVLLWLKHEHIN